jgi:integrase
MRLTAKTVENLKPRDRRIEIPDSGCHGLYLVIQPSGAKSWAVRYRYQGRPTKLTLNGGTSLAGARKAATDALHELEGGRDPAAARKATKVAAMEAATNTVASVCAAYMKREGGKLRTSDARESIFQRLINPAIGERPIGGVKRREIVAMLDGIEDTSGPRMADVTLAVLRRVFTWHALRDDDFANPIVRGMARQKAAEHRRTRILDDDEIRALWAATADDTVFSALIRVLLLSGARRNEIARMKWGEIDADGVWTLPAARSKTATEIIRPLSKAALALIEQMPQIDGCPFVFVSATGRTPVSQFAAPTARLRVASGVTGWRLHDLRRTSRSLLSRAGINSDVAEKCLGHSRGDIIERYDLHKFLPEMTHAFEALAALIERIANPPDTAVVVPLAVRR